MSQGFTDWTDLGIFPCQDVEEDVPTGMRHALAGARLEKMPDPGSGGDITPTFARENELGTLGDVHPWLFWQTKEREKRASGSWSMAWAGLITKGATVTGRYAGKPAELQPLTNSGDDVVNDIRYATLEPNWQEGLPMRVAGQIQMVMPSVDETTPGSLLVHGDPRLVAAAVKGPGEAGTLVVDLQGEGELCMDGSSTPGKGGRHARLQSIFRVIALGQNASTGAAPLNGIAINYALSQQDKILGLGMIFAKLESGGGTGPKTGGPVVTTPKLPGPITGQRSSATGGGNAFAAGMKSGGAKSGGAASGSGTFGKANAGAGGEDDDELTPIDFGEFKKAPFGGHGIGLNAQVGGCGPITIGAKGDKHEIGKDEDGNPINSSHLSTNAYFFRDQDYDGPLLFEDEFPQDVKEHKIKTHVHLSWDRSLSHKFVKGTRQGMWRWWTTVPYVSPTKTPNGDVPTTTKRPGPTTPGGPTPTGPTRPGPGTPGPRPVGPTTPRGGGPTPTGPTRPGPGPGRALTGGPGAPGAPRPAGPTTGGPNAPGPVAPADGRPEGPKTPGPSAPGAPAAGGPPPPGGDEELGQDDGRYLGDPITPVGARGQAGRGTVQRGLDIEPLGDADYRDAGDPVGVVNKVGQDRRGQDVGVYSIFHPYSEGFAALGFRPQLTIKGAPNFEHNPNLSATVLEIEELTRPTVLTARAWGAQSESGDWSYTDRPEDARARGGHADGGVFFSPPEFELADYLGVTPADVTAVNSTAWVAYAPTVRVGFGTPSTDGSMDAGTNVITVPAATSPLNFGQVIADKSVTTIAEMSLFDDVGYFELHGTGSMKLPVGTTAQQPSVSVAGEFRYNSTTSGLEFYNGSAWTAVGGGGSSTWVGLSDTVGSLGAPGTFVYNNAGTLDFVDHTGAADPHPGYVLNAELTSHEGAADPHPGYVLNAELTAHETAAVHSWLKLTDTTPTTFATHGGKVVSVNSGETGLEFTVPIASPDVMLLNGANTMTGSLLMGDQWLDGGTLSLFKNSTGQYILGDYSNATILFIRTATSGKYGRMTAGATDVVMDAVGASMNFVLQTQSGHVDLYPNGALAMRCHSGGNIGIGDTNPGASLEITKDPAATPDDAKGLALSNDTAATSGNQKYSPMLRFSGAGWGTLGGSSELNRWRQYLIPVEGSASTVDMTWESVVGGGSYAEQMRYVGASRRLQVGDAGTTESGLVAGTGFMGTWTGGTGFAVFAHDTVAATVGSYAVLQQNDGSTFINAASTKTLGLRIANTDVAVVSASALTMSQPIAMGSNKITGLTAGTASGEAVEFDQLKKSWFVQAAAQTGATITTLDLQANGNTIREGTDGGIAVPITCTLGKVAINSWGGNDGGGARSWKLRCRVNGGGSDTADFTFTIPDGGAAFVATQGDWTTSPGATITAGDRLELFVDDNSTGSVPGVWVNVTVELIET